MCRLNIPIYNGIKKYINSNPLPFHTPGHKLGKGIPRDILENLPFMDVTEIYGTDNLHFPEGIIKEAQTLASEAFGADDTFFLVNGSTSGVHSMIMTICNPGDEFIVSRDCHKSVIAGMILAGVRPIYLKPEVNRDFGISTIVSPSLLEQTLEQNLKATGVLITRPNYYGICSDIERIAEIVHRHGKILAVDEAHGTHLKFGDGLPICAMDGGADICVQSAHKTIPAFTQGSYLHIKHGRVNEDKLKSVLGMLQTSSPSYIIMAMLDVARDIMQRDGKNLLSGLLYNIDKIHKNTQNSGFKWLSPSDLDGGDKDPTRVVINVSELGLTGYEAGDILRKRYNIHVEMSDIRNIVCILTISDGLESMDGLLLGLMGLSEYSQREKAFYTEFIKEPDIPMQAIELKDVFQLKGIRISLNNAKGRVSKEIITPYPPGIPIVCPGEVITKEIIEYMEYLIAAGCSINGIGKKLDVLVVE